MTDTSKRELIEEAAKAIRDAGGGMPFSWESLSEGHREQRRAQARAAFAVFEQAHTPTRTVIQITPEAVQREYELRNGVTPTDDEREAILSAIDSTLSPAKSCQVDGCQHSTGFQDSGSNDWCACHYHDDPTECQGEPGPLPPHRERLADAILAAVRRGFRRPVQAEAMREVQGEPTDAPTVQLVARRGGKTQALIDSMLAQANERGIRVEVVYPHGEPTDATVLAALNAHYRIRAVQSGFDEPEDAPSLDLYSSQSIDRMRAALTEQATDRENGSESQAPGAE